MPFRQHAATYEMTTPDAPTRPRPYCRPVFDVFQSCYIRCMRAWWIAALVAACGSKKQERPYVDEWATRAFEPFANKLVEDTLVNPATLEFTIQLPHGMFHDPSSDSSNGHHYGVWNDNSLQVEGTPGAVVRLAPHGPKTLDDLTRDWTRGDELVAKETLADGTLSITTRRGTHAWYVVQVHFDVAGRAIHCAAWRHDDKRDLADSTRRMLEKMCGSLEIAERSK